MKNCVIIEAKREGYSPDQCGSTMTVRELINELELYSDDDEVYLSHDNGYTYGSISQGDISVKDCGVNEAGRRELSKEISRCLDEGTAPASRLYSNSRGEMTCFRKFMRDNLKYLEGFLKEKLNADVFAALTAPEFTPSLGTEGWGGIIFQGNGKWPNVEIAPKGIEFYVGYNPPSKDDGSDGEWYAAENDPDDGEGLSFTAGSFAEACDSLVWLVNHYYEEGSES